MYNLYKLLPETFSFRQTTYNSNGLINSLASGIPYLAFFFSLTSLSKWILVMCTLKSIFRSESVSLNPPSLRSKKPALETPYLIGWFHIFLIFLSIQSKSHVWGRVYTNAVSFVTASFSMRLCLHPTPVDTVCETGSIWKRCQEWSVFKTIRFDLSYKWRNRIDLSTLNILLRNLHFSIPNGESRT